MNSLLTLSVALLAVPFCWGLGDYGDETAVNWSDYGQAVLLDNRESSTFYLGFWVSRKFVVGPKNAVPNSMIALYVQSGDIKTSPLTHIVDKVIDIDMSNSGQVVIFKVCNPPSSPLTVQTLAMTDYWDATATTNSGLFLYVKNPSKDLYTRTTGNLPKQSDCADLLDQGECTAMKSTAAHEVCADWDPLADACKHIVDVNGTVKTSPWLTINGRMQAFLTTANCKDDGSSLSGPIFGSIHFSLSEIKTATFL